MAKKVVEESSLISVADAIRERAGTTSKLVFPEGWEETIRGISSAGFVPSGTIYITKNGTHAVSQYASANVQVEPILQEKTMSPSNKDVAVGPDSGYDALSRVVIKGDKNLTAENIKSGVTIFDVVGTLEPFDENNGFIEVDDLSDLHAWYKNTIAGTVIETDVADIVLCQATSVAGFEKVDYADTIQVSSNEFTLNNPVNHTLTSRASTLNVIKGKYIYSYRTKNYYYIPSDATVSYQAGTIYHTVTVDKARLLTYTGAGGSTVGIVVSDNSSAYPHNGTQDGYLYEYIGVLGESVSDPVLQALIVDPKTTQQVITPDEGYDGFSKVTVNAMPAATQATPSISVNSSGLITASATQTAGYVSAGTKSATQQLSTQAATEVTPSTSTKTAVTAGKYTTGAVTVKGDTNLVAGNIKKGVKIFDVTGSLEEGITLPTLSNPGAAADLVAGEQLIDQNGNIVAGEMKKQTLLLISADENAEFKDSSLTGLTITAQHDSDFFAMDRSYINPDDYKVRLSISKNEDTMSNFGTARAEDVASGKTFTSVDGYLVRGTHICEAGIDTSDATARPEDIVSGTTAYISEGKVNGAMEKKTLLLTYTDDGTEISYNSLLGIVLTGRHNSESFPMQRSYIDPDDFKVRLTINDKDEVAMANFGDVRASDVTAGKTFTSVDGYKVEGTHTEPVVSFANGVLSIR